MLACKQAKLQWGLLHMLNISTSVLLLSAHKHADVSQMPSQSLWPEMLNRTRYQTQRWRPFNPKRITSYPKNVSLLQGLRPGFVAHRLHKYITPPWFFFFLNPSWSWSCLQFEVSHQFRTPLFHNGRLWGKCFLRIFQCNTTSGHWAKLETRLSSVFFF